MTNAHGGPRQGSGRPSKEELEAIASGASPEAIQEIRQRKLDEAEQRRIRLVAKRKRRKQRKAAKRRKVAAVRSPASTKPPVPEKPEEEPEKVPAEPKRQSRAMAMALDIIRQSHALAARKQRDERLNPFQLPQFPPAAMPPEASGLRMEQVRKGSGGMAMDNSLGWAGQAWAASTIEGTADAGLQFMGYPFLTILAQRPEYRIPAETIADDATRRWLDFEIVGEKRQKDKDQEERNRVSGQQPGRSFEDPDPDEREARTEASGKMDKVKAIKDELTRLEARDRFYCVSRDDSFFGRSHLYLNFGTDIDGDAPDELRTPIGDGRDELSKGKVSKDKPLRSLRVVEPVWTYPTTYNAVNPLREDWYNPQVWYVLGKEIHRSRLPTFIGRPIPDLLKPAYSFGGVSLSQLLKPYVDIWLTTRASIGQLIHSFSVMVLMTDMQTILQEANGEGLPNVGGLLARVAEFNALRDNQNTFVLNKESEDFKNVSASLAGLHELQAQAQEHMAATARIPLVKFTGIAPSGLNACLTGDTLIETDQGQVAIRDARPGQKVMTRDGWAPIAKAGCTGYATELIEIETAESTIRCTADHRIWLPSINAFVPARNVRRGHLLLCRGATESQNTANQLPIEVASGGKQRLAIMPLRQTMPVNLFSTGKFGEFITDLFQKAITFIISTRITQTINSTISSRLRPLSMQSYMALDHIFMPKIANTGGSVAIAASHSSSWGNQRELSSAAMIAGSLIGERTGHRKPSRGQSAFVSCAAHLSNRSERTQNIVLESAQLQARTALHICPTTTTSIARNGSNTTSAGNLSVVSSVRRVPAHEYVYDIQVAHGFLPEFFANGICVHNSSEGEVRTYYDTISAYQNRFFRPQLTRLINFVQLSLFDEIDPEITFEFEPLWEMSEKERAELQKMEAERDQIFVDGGAIGNDEWRAKIIDDPKLPFADLNPEDIPDLRSEEEEGLIPEGGGRAVEGLLEAGPEIGPGPAAAPGEEGGQQQPQQRQAPAGKDPAFQDTGGRGGAASVLPFLEAGDAKVSKAKADYVPSIEDVTEQCSQCSMFRRITDTFEDNRCNLVDGDISALGHCRHFQQLSPEGQRDNPDAIFHGSGIGDDEPYWAEGSNVGPKPPGKTVHDAGWEESKHKRGQPGNAGQFGSGGGGSQQKGPQPRQEGPGAQRTAPAVQQPTPQEAQRQAKPVRRMRSEADRAYGPHIAEQLEKLTPAQKEKHAGHVKKTREFFSGDGSRKATARSVREFMARHAVGVAQHHLQTAVLMPAIHHVVEQAVEMTGLGSIPGVTLGATAVAAYSVHQLMEQFNFTLSGGVELMRGVVKGSIEILRGTKEVAGQVAKLEKEHGITARDAEDDPVLTALMKLLVALDEMEDEDEDGAEAGAADSSLPLTLYVSRPLTNAADLIAWARENGIEKTLPAGEMHVTIAFSKTPVDWAKVGESSDHVVTKSGDARSLEPLGNEGAIVLRFESAKLADRWKQIMDDAGASWDWPGYKPHVTVTYDAGDVDVSKIEPYRGELRFGPERLAEIDEDWAAKIRDSLVASDEAQFEESKHPRDEGGKFASSGGGASNETGGNEQKKKAKLTPTEKAYLSSYSGDDFLRLNKELREGKDGGEAAKKLDSAIAKSPLSAGTKLYRGMSKQALKTLLGGDEIKAGDVLSDKAFLSTSSDPWIGNEMGGVQLQIDIGENQTGLDLSQLSSNEHESEVLLPRNTALKVTGIRAPKQVGQPIVVKVTTVDLAESVKSSSAYAPGVKASGVAKAVAQKNEWRKTAPDTVEAVLAAAPIHQAVLAETCRAIAEKVGAKFTDPGVKAPGRIKDKLARGKTPQQVNDAVRGGFDVDGPDQADEIIKQLAEKFEVADEGWGRTAAGYFDRKAMVRFDDGTIGEVQFWPPGMLETKEKKGHSLYEAWQKAMPGPEKAKLLGAQVALYSAIAASLPQAWHSINFAPA